MSRPPTYSSTSSTPPLSKRSLPPTAHSRSRSNSSRNRPRSVSDTPPVSPAVESLSRVQVHSDPLEAHPEPPIQSKPGVAVRSESPGVFPPSSERRPDLNGNEHDHENGHDDDHRASFFERMNPQMVLENSGSVARDHLANERTWLAYIRTSLAIASTGVALVQLFTISAQKTGLETELQRFARPLGATTVMFGIIVLIIGFLRYFNIQSALTTGMFPPARKTAAFISAFLGVLVTVVFGILVGFKR